MTRTTPAGRACPCPRCRSRDVAEVVYGLVYFDAFRPVPGKLGRDLRAGRATLGGCCITEFDRECNECRCRFSSVDGSIDPYGDLWNTPIEPLMVNGPDEGLNAEPAGDEGGD